MAADGGGKRRHPALTMAALCRERTGASGPPRKDRARWQLCASPPGGSEAQGRSRGDGEIGGACSFLTAPTGTLRSGPACSEPGTVFTVFITDGMGQPVAFWPCGLRECVSIGSRTRHNTCVGTTPCAHLPSHTCAFPLPRPLPGQSWDPTQPPNLTPGLSAHS